VKSHQIEIEVGPLEKDLNVRIGSLAALWTHSSLMSGFGRKADVHVGQFCENLGDIPGCPLFSEADVQIIKNQAKIGSAFGQKRTSLTQSNKESQC